MDDIQQMHPLFAVCLGFVGIGLVGLVLGPVLSVVADNFRLRRTERVLSKAGVALLGIAGAGLFSAAAIFCLSVAYTRLFAS